MELHHFTSISGLEGILSAGAIQPRVCNDWGESLDISLVWLTSGNGGPTWFQVDGEIGLQRLADEPEIDRRRVRITVDVVDVVRSDSLLVSLPSYDLALDSWRQEWWVSQRPIPVRRITSIVVDGLRYKSARLTEEGIAFDPMPR